MLFLINLPAPCKALAAAEPAYKDMHRSRDMFEVDSLHDRMVHMALPDEAINRIVAWSQPSHPG